MESSARSCRIGASLVVKGLTPYYTLAHCGTHRSCRFTAPAKASLFREVNLFLWTLLQMMNEIQAVLLTSKVFKLHMQESVI